MIYYSRQNQIDLCPVNWSFDDSSGRFYNWKNQPVDEVYQIPPRRVRNQIYIEDSEATTITVTPIVYDAKTGEEITGTVYIYSIPTELPGMLWEFFIGVSLIEPYVNFYVEVTIDYDSGTRIETLRSSCFTIEVNDDDKLLRIDYGNTIIDRLVGGVMFFDGIYQQRYIYLDKYDTEIEIVDDEQSTDFEGNAVLVDKTHKETDVFSIIQMPKKFFMGLVTISQNDIIYVNSRRANIALEKVTESKIGAFEIPYINAFMRVTYADDDGLLDTQSQTEADYLLINSVDHLLINTLDILKTR